MGKKLLILSTRKDEKFLRELICHLNLMERQGEISITYEGKFPVGDNYNDSFQRSLGQADIIMPLLSSDFLASDIYTRLEQHLLVSGTVPKIVVPIIIRAIDWPVHMFSNRTVLPDNAIPVKLWHERDYAWTNIVRRIREIIANNATDT